MFIYKTINDIKTLLLTFGDPFESTASEIIVVIIGSPGIPEFYTEFAQELYHRTQLPVCVIGHAGHDVTENIEEQPDLYNLDNQIEHKLYFLNKHLDKNSKLHIIGHSIGAWMLVELLHKNDYLLDRISSVNLLFPTLQKFSETPNGKYVNNIVRQYPGIILLLFFIVQWAPNFLRLFLIKLFLVLISWPSHYVNRISLYLNPIIQRKSIRLACESLDRVNELNKEALNKVKHLTNVVYCLGDRWVPMHHIRDLKTFEPHIVFKEVNADHAFVLNYPVLVGYTVSRLIKNRMKRQRLLFDF